MAVSNLFQKKSVFTSIIFMLVCYSTYAQSKIKGNREVTSNQSTVADFNTISVGDELEVVLMNSTYPSVTIMADSNLHSAINYSVRDSILNFQVTKRIKRSKEFKVIIRYTKSLNTIVLEGNADLESETPFELNKLNLTLNDDAKINATIKAKEFSLQNNNDSSLKLTTNCKLILENEVTHLDLKQNSNNKIELNTKKLHVYTHDNAELNVEGFAFDLEMEATNNTGIKAKNLLTSNAKLKISEKANVAIQASDTIYIDASGSSKIELYGEPKIIVDNLANTAEIEKKEF